MTDTVKSSQLPIVSAASGDYLIVLDESTGRLVRVLVSDLGEIIGGGGSWGEIDGTLAEQTDLVAALGAKAPLSSPTFTNVPAAPTASAGTNTTQLATTAFVQSTVSATVTHSTVSLATAGTTTLSIATGTRQTFAEVNLSNSVSAYTRKIVLPTANRVAGDLARIAINFAVPVGAFSAARAEVRNATDSGTVLYEWGDATIWGPRTVTMDFVFNGTAWVSASRDEDSFGTITCFISPHGNDATGAKGDPSRPYKTLQGAYDGNNGVMPVVRVEPGCESADLALTCESLGLILSCDDTPSLGVIVINSNGGSNNYIYGAGSRFATRVTSIAYTNTSTSQAGLFALKNLEVGILTIAGANGTNAEGSGSGSDGCASPELQLNHVHVSSSFSVTGGNGGNGADTGDGGSGGDVSAITILNSELTGVTGPTAGSGGAPGENGGSGGASGEITPASCQFSTLNAGLSGATYQLCVVNGVVTGAGSGSSDMVLADVQSITGAKTFDDSTLRLAGSSSGTGTLKAPAAASTYAWVLPEVSGALAPAALTINTQTDSYTLVLADALPKYVRMNKGTACNLTVPANASVAFPLGTQIVIRNTGAGQVTIVASGGVTINTSQTLKLRAQHSTASLVKVGTNEWDLSGDLEAP